MAVVLWYIYTYTFINEIQNASEFSYNMNVALSVTVTVRTVYTTTPKEGICIFPFTYNGNTYYTCTSVDNANDKFWCAFDAVYVANEWGLCDPRTGSEYPEQAHITTLLGSTLNLTP